MPVAFIAGTPLSLFSSPSAATSGGLSATTAAGFLAPALHEDAIGFELVGAALVDSWVLSCGEDTSALERL